MPPSNVKWRDARDARHYRRSVAAGEGSALDHCFVFGCGRTGSTPLVRLLGAHANLAIGMERYKHLLRDVRRNHDPSLFVPALFDPKRFLDFRPGDTNILPPRFEEHYGPIAHRLATGTITQMGDKLVPTDVYTLRSVADQFPQARFVFVFRDLVRVANSFEVRARNPRDVDWASDHGVAMGCRQWTDSFDQADVLVDHIGADRVFPVHTAHLFQADDRLCRALFGFLGLEVTPDVQRALEKLTREWQLRQAVPLVLDPSTQDGLALRVDRPQVHRYTRWVDLVTDSVDGDPEALRRLSRHTADLALPAAVRTREVDERLLQTRRRRRALADLAEMSALSEVSGVSGVSGAPVEATPVLSPSP